MTLIRVDQVREAIIDKLKANTTIMALLSDSDEVREASWKGTDFSYPNYRVRINNITPFQDCYQQLDATILCFSEQASSQQCEEMAGTVANEFHNGSFEQDSIMFTHIVADIIPAFPQTMRTWRSEVQIKSLVNFL